MFLKSLLTLLLKSVKYSAEVHHLCCVSMWWGVVIGFRSPGISLPTPQRHRDHVWTKDTDTEIFTSLSRMWQQHRCFISLNTVCVVSCRCCTPITHPYYVQTTATSIHTQTYSSPPLVEPCNYCGQISLVASSAGRKQHDCFCHPQFPLASQYQFLSLHAHTGIWQTHDCTHTSVRITT